MAGVGLWRFILMKHDFDLVNYIPSSSYAHAFVMAKRDYFERQGIATNIYCGERILPFDSSQSFIGTVLECAIKNFAFNLLTSKHVKIILSANV